MFMHYCNRLKQQVYYAVGNKILSLRPQISSPFIHLCLPKLIAWNSTNFYLMKILISLFDFIFFLEMLRENSLQTIL